MEFVGQLLAHNFNSIKTDALTQPIYQCK